MNDPGVTSVANSADAINALLATISASPEQPGKSASRRRKDFIAQATPA